MRYVVIGFLILSQVACVSASYEQAQKDAVAVAYAEGMKAAQVAKPEARSAEGLSSQPVVTPTISLDEAVSSLKSFKDGYNYCRDEVPAELQSQIQWIPEEQWGMK